MDRQANLEHIRDRTVPWDIIVIGGGATGVGCALDAASRGYQVLLLEQHDLGKGTSSRSTKLIHGGVRYLRQGNISLVRESLRERGILLKNAPHVVHKQEFVIPCYSRWQKFYYAAGLKIYDLLAGKYGLGSSKMLSRSEVIAALPTIESEGLKGGILYYDGQFDDTRLLIDLALTATKHGASILNYAKVTSLAKTGEGRVSGLTFEDVETGELFEVEARSVINATGAFCDEVRTMSDAAARPVLTFSQGVHVVVNGKYLAGDAAIMIPETIDGRVLFCIPWHGHTLLGTTDTPVKQAELEPAALDHEIDLILETVAGYLNEPPKLQDILSVFAGIRPLVSRSAASKTSSLSRSHELFLDPSGLVTITGGKWTTYRQMAEDAVDKAAESGELDMRPCITANLSIDEPPESGGQHSPPLHEGLPYTRDDVIRAVNDEMAQTLEDVLARRTRALFLNAAAAVEMAEDVARMMAAETGRSEEWVHEQLAAFHQTARSYKSRYSRERKAS
jgi:glycerol-3-phosphate dehydrogenase